MHRGPLGQAGPPIGVGHCLSGLEHLRRGRTLEDGGPAQRVGELDPVAQEGQGAQLRGGAQGLDGEVRLGQRVLEDRACHEGGGRDGQHGARLAAQAVGPRPEGVGELGPDGQRVGQWHVAVELLVAQVRAGGQQRGRVAAGGPPQLGQDRGVREFADPLQEVVGGLVEGERLQLVHREGRAREGKRRAVGVVAPGEHQHRGDTELWVEDGGGERLGHVLVGESDVLVDDQHRARPVPRRRAEGRHEGLPEVVGILGRVLGPGDGVRRQLVGVLEGVAPVSRRAVDAGGDRESCHREAGGLGDHALDEIALARSGQTVDAGDGAVPGAGVPQHLLEMGALAPAADQRFGRKGL